MATLFVADIPERRVSLETAASAGDWPLVGRTVHTLAGSAAAVGAAALLETARRLETAVAEVATETVRRLLPDFLTELDRVLRGLQAFLARVAAAPPAAP